MPLGPGKTLGAFRIVSPLGRGGMATVYRAYEPALDRHVALKVLPREFLHDPGFAERFTREARAIARLEHPNIVPIYAYDIDREEGIPWMALRLVGSADPERPGGGALSEILKRGLVGPRRAVEILRGVADALDHAHGKGVVHRDVKPQNVLLDEDGRVYLADFGIARMLESSGGLTATGMITGTPQYMAPEQATGTKVGPAADVYALGIVAYEMLTGRVPFAADTPVATLMKQVQEPLPLPPLSRVPAPLVQAILRCTAKRPEDRWPSAGAFVSALEAGLEAPARADPCRADAGAAARGAASGRDADRPARPKDRSRRARRTRVGRRVRPGRRRPAWPCCSCAAPRSRRPPRPRLPGSSRRRRSRSAARRRSRGSSSPPLRRPRFAPRRRPRRRGETPSSAAVAHATGDRPGDGGPDTAAGGLAHTHSHASLRFVPPPPRPPSTRRSSAWRPRWRSRIPRRGGARRRTSPPLVPRPHRRWRP